MSSGKLLTISNFVEKSRFVHGDKFDYSKSVYKNSKTKIIIICPEHGEFEQRPNDHLNGVGCKKCGVEKRSSDRKLSFEDFVKRSKYKHGDKYDYSKFDYVNVDTKGIIICPEHGEFEQRPYNHMKGENCRLCYNNSVSLRCRKDRDIFIAESRKVHGDKYDYSKVNYKNNKKKVKIICKYHGDFYQSPVGHIQSCQGCPSCANEKKSIDQNLGIEEFVSNAKKIHGDKFDYSKSVYIKSLTKLIIICPKHGEFEQRPNDHLNNRGCPVCSVGRTSEMEKEFIRFIKNSIDLKIISNSKKIISPLELDVYIPDLNLAIEFNGLYWHNEENKDNSYHLNKTKMCELKGIHLIHVYEDDWLFKHDIVKSRIKSILGLCDVKLSARKCQIREVSYDDSKKFLEKNHIQGNCASKIRVGLYFEDELVSLMTFGNLRRNLGYESKEGYYELLRFCNKLGYIVNGSAGKLFKYFLRNYNPLNVLSYADRSWSYFKDNLYCKLGFSFSHFTRPNYFYVIDRKRENRFKYRKSVLVEQGYDSNLTEREIMESRAIPRIYDSGSLCYIYEN